MAARIIVAIASVPVLTAIFALSIAWYARSLTSENSRARCYARIAESLIWLPLLAIYAVTENGQMRKLAIACLCFVLALWLFRGARFLLHKRKQA